MKNEFKREKPNSTELVKSLFSFWNVIIPLCIIFFGLWISTQRFAELLNFNSDIVGDPFFITKSNYPVYYPWLFAGWVLKYWINTELGPYFYTARQPAMIASVIALGVFVLISVTRLLINAKTNLYGTARWAFDKELRKKGLMTTSGVVCGELNDAQLEATRIKDTRGNDNIQLKLLKPAPLICHSGSHSTLMIAGSGDGKGISTVLPTALSYPHSMLIFDPKAEIYNSTAGHRRKWTRVLRFAPVSRDSLGFNFLMQLRDGDNCYRDAQQLATDLLTPFSAKEGDEAAEYFRKSATDFLTGGILHVRCSDFKDKSLYGVYQMFTMMGSDAEESDTEENILQSWFDSTHCDSFIHDVVAGCARRQKQRNDKDKGYVLNTIFTALQVFEDPVVRQNTTNNDFSVEDFINPDVPISLYLTVPYNDIKRLAPLIRLIIAFILGRFCGDETQHGEIKLKYNILCLFDEFPTLKFMPVIRDMMGVTRGYGIYFLLVCQSFSQLVDIYGVNHPFLEHCKTIITFAPGLYSTAEELAKISGKESVNKKSISHGFRLFGNINNVNVSDGEVERFLINADELMKLPPTDLILFHRGMPPYAGKKVVCYDDFRFKDYLNLPYPKTRNELLAFCLPPKKITGVDWFDLPLFNCFSSPEDDEFDEDLIDPIFAQKRIANLAEIAISLSAEEETHGGL